MEDNTCCMGVPAHGRVQRIGSCANNCTHHYINYCSHYCSNGSIHYHANQYAHADAD